MKLELDSHGVCQYPNFHDGSLLGIVLQQPKTVKLSLEHVDGTLWELTVDNVVRFRANEFLEGNIVYDIVVRDGSQCDERFLCAVYDLDAGDSNLKKITDQMRSGEWAAMKLHCSYGCELFLLANSGKEKMTVTKIEREKGDSHQN